MDDDEVTTSTETDDVDGHGYLRKGVAPAGAEPEEDDAAGHLEQH